ncbi:MAG: hypothetical protein NZ927_08190 [Candidatus Calescibacterium sp.]|nr:hypothetical protein [Candidatus Calescibacterium sp.]MCX7734942.1 hypothetical protein [bacterium]MDW8087997.1 hypothetical protein [Candidatus Calescibacterium sp.]
MIFGEKRFFFIIFGVLCFFLSFLHPKVFAQSKKQILLEVKKDPFAIEIDKKDQERKAKDVRPEKEKNRTKEEKLSFKLLGVSISGETKVVLFSVDDQTYILSEGDSVPALPNIKIKKISEDYIELIFGKEEFRLSF